MTTPKVSVVIPTLNAGPGFKELLEGIRAQEGDPEIVVVDSGSTDGTAELAEEHGATVRRIPKAEFDHGATRNFGISLSGGEFVVLTVQDAVPLDGRWLPAMVENLQNDGRVAAVYGRHVPRPSAGLLTRALVNNLAAADPERRVQEVRDPATYRALPAAQRRHVAAIDNVSSCLRRSVWNEIPLPRAAFAEDLRWGKKVVEAGYKIVYEPRSVVVHSHERGPLYDLKRHYVDALVLEELFGAGPVPTLPRLLLGVPHTARHVHGLLLRQAPGENPLRLAPTALTYAAPALLGAYLGSKGPLIPRHAPRLHRLLSRGV